MSARAEDFIEGLDRRVRDMLDACTACGDCVRVSPTPAHTGTDVSDPAAVAEGVLDTLKTGRVRRTQPPGRRNAARAEIA